MTPGDPIEASRNVSRQDAAAEQRAKDIRVLVARGLIYDLVTELARVLANRSVTGPEEVALQDAILRETMTYTRVLSSGPAAIEYMSPITQARQVEEQSRAVSELKRMAVENKVIGEIEQAVQEALQESKEPIPFGLPKNQK